MSKIIYTGEDINIIAPDEHDDTNFCKALSISDDRDEDGRDAFAYLVPDLDLNNGPCTLTVVCSENRLIDLLKINGFKYARWQDAISDLELAAID